MPFHRYGSHVKCSPQALVFKHLVPAGGAVWEFLAMRGLVEGFESVEIGLRGIIAASGSAWALCFPVAAGIRPRTTNPYCCALLPWWTASFKSWAPKNFSLQLLFPDRLWWPRKNNNTVKANVYLCFRSIWNCCTVGKACGLLYETISMALF